MKVSVEYQALAPIIILMTSGVLSVLVEAFITRTIRRPIQLMLVLASIVLALKEEIAVTTLGDLWLETTTQLTVIDLSIILPLA